ncbi:MAG TPA: MogA/MoaB family molybdenum cofactor biosynthesis protein [Pseudogracilibacillus sp.]|nr:MogA/MoaB family molybdenum cofactor biosynthesis protein [Pseudogracilibacillus sp.]
MHTTKTKTIKCLIGTVSDTRTVETDKSGQLIKSCIEEAGHHCASHQIVKDDQAAIEDLLFQGINNLQVDVVILTGGTGIAKRDVTIEVVERHMEKTIPGFGEIFRMLSYTEDIGSKAILSRATAGVKRRTAVFALPGSSGAVKLAMERLIIPELTHLISELHK